VQKNVGSQKIIFFAFDSTTNTPKTGDAANITGYISKDFGAVTVLGDTSATEMDATNAKGYYLFDVTQTETNADVILGSAKSTTANIVVVGAPATIFTTPASFTGGGVVTNTPGRVRHLPKVKGVERETEAEKLARRIREGTIQAPVVASSSTGRFSLFQGVRTARYSHRSGKERCRDIQAGHRALHAAGRATAPIRGSPSEADPRRASPVARQGAGSRIDRGNGSN
jgi:hypothetical protein